MSSTKYFVDDLLATFPNSFNSKQLALLRKRLVEQELLPKSRGKSYAVMDTKGAGIFLSALGMGKDTIAAVTSTLAVAGSCDTSGTVFSEAISTILSDSNPDNPDSYVYVSSITVSKSSPYACINYGRLDSENRVREFGKKGDGVVENYSTISAPLIQWAGSYFQNLRTEEGEQVS